MNRQEALDLSIKKWTLASQAKNTQELYSIAFNNCGFCDYFNQGRDIQDLIADCKPCPLYPTLCDGRDTSRLKGESYSSILFYQIHQMALKRVKMPIPPILKEMVDQMLSEIKTRGAKWIKEEETNGN